MNKDLKRMDEEGRRMEEKIDSAEETHMSTGEKSFNESRNMFKPPGAKKTKIALSKDLQLLDEIRNFDRERGLRRTRGGECVDPEIYSRADKTLVISTVVELHEIKDEDKPKPRRENDENPTSRRETDPTSWKKIEPWKETDSFEPGFGMGQHIEPRSKKECNTKEKERRISQSSLGVGETRFRFYRILNINIFLLINAIHGLGGIGR